MIDEYKELQERIGKLSTFISGPIFAELDSEEKIDMQGQLHGMTIYKACLESRLKRKKLLF